MKTSQTTESIALGSGRYREVGSERISYMAEALSGITSHNWLGEVDRSRDNSILRMSMCKAWRADGARWTKW